MKKYDCSKTEDFIEAIHELAASSCDIKLNMLSETMCRIEAEEDCKAVEYVQKLADERLCRYTDLEIEIAKTTRAVVRDAKYIAQDKSEKVIAFRSKPHLTDRFGGSWDEDEGWYETDFIPYTKNYKESLIDVDKAIKQGERNE